MGITLNRADGCRTLLFSGNRDDAYVTPRTYSLRTDGDILSGGKTFKLHLPGGIPAKLFWSLTVYDGEHASGLDNGQLLPSINAMDKPKANDDGSVDIYFGPEEPKGAAN